MFMHIARFAVLFTLASTLSFAAERPNIVVIMTDDMGFSDLGCFGSEIQTPNLDRLAGDGLRFTQFYNTGRCCPTRASLLTGLYAHQAGMGGMTADEGPARPGYRGRLMDRCVTIAEVLKPAGYRTIQTGKWHVGDKQKSWWPLGRGFERCFGSPAGGGFYFRPSAFKQPRQVVRGNTVVFDQQNDPPQGWYTTDAYTDEGIEYVKESIADQKPFFWYLAYNAPHFPLKAKPADIKKYRGKYIGGWDQLRRERHRRLVELGIIDASWKLSERAAKVPAWNDLPAEQKDKQDLRMATYAAMIDCIDQNVGKVISELERLGVYKNTLILFLHDNGGCSEGGTLGKNSGTGECGTADSFAYYGQCWANASNTPFRKFKKYIHEGGIATPLIAHWPLGIDPNLNGTFVRQPTHVIDLMATCVDVGKASYPRVFADKKIIPLEGKSLQPFFRGQPVQRDEALYFEHMGNRGVRDGKWKLVAFKGREWELYDLEKDRTELNDLAKQEPAIVEGLAAKYERWAERCFVTKKK